MFRRPRLYLGFLFAIMAVIGTGVLVVSCAPLEEPPQAQVDFGPPSVASQPLPHAQCSDAVCGPVSSEPPPVDPVTGRRIFVANGCSGCHYVDKEDKLVGPGLLNVTERAGARIAGYSAEQYVAESLRQPSAYVVEGYPSPSTMPTFSADSINSQDLRNVFAYLDTLR